MRDCFDRLFDFFRDSSCSIMSDLHTCYWRFPRYNSDIVVDFIPSQFGYSHCMVYGSINR